MAYPSIASITRTIKSLLASNSPVQSVICNHKEEILALHEKVSSLEVFLKNFKKSNASRKTTDLEVEINKVVNAVEHTIQLRITEMVMANDEMQEEKAHKRFCCSLQQVSQDIDRVLTESSKDMVGRADQRKILLDDLTRGFNDQPKVIPIVGMGGIGKTTLAKDVFDDVTIRSHFDVRAWATISKEHNVKDILVSLLHSTKEKDGIIHIEDEAKLADMLQKTLKGKRYLIVLDDIWKNEAWDDVRLCFPSENKGSRILLTTRNTEVACFAGTENLSLRLDFMNPVESWNLFNTLPGNEALPFEFETVGKQIVEKCQGLPLTTVVVAGLLSKCKRTIQVWKDVAKDVKSFVKNDRDKQCQHVLGLSYNNLTSDLKPCLLYFGIFPEDSEISVKRLVRLWTAEGFLKSEEEAEKCLQELIDRFLVLVSRKSRYETKIRSCKVHDLIYELCLREAEKRTFFVINDIVFNDEPNHVPYHHLSRHKMRHFMGGTDDILRRGSYRALLIPRHRKKTDDDDNNSLKRTRSIFSFCRDSSTFTLKSELTHFNLIRILDLSCIKINIFPPQILCLIWLRYLVLRSRRGVFDIPPEISRLWSLQTFIVGGYHLTSTILPEQIWELMQLRHLVLSSFHLPNPPIVSVEEEKCLDFPNLHTISGLSLSCCTKEVISGIRNVKKLRVNGDVDDYESFQIRRLFDNFIHLHQLETLSLVLEYRGVLAEISPATIPNVKYFPPMLKKLKLYGTGLRWEELNIIGELPNLEILKLKRYACRGQEWHPAEKGFTQLKLLLIEYNDLKYWNSPNDNFPVLERLVIRDCSELEDIPIDFAYIDSLQQIELTVCTPELVASAARIQHEQEENLGKKPVDLLISSGAHSAAKADEEEDGEEEEEEEEEEEL